MTNVLNDPQNKDEQADMYVIMLSLSSLENERLAMIYSGTYHDCLGIDMQIAFRKIDLITYMN